MSLFLHMQISHEATHLLSLSSVAINTDGIYNFGILAENLFVWLVIISLVKLMEDPEQIATQIIFVF